MPSSVFDIASPGSGALYRVTCVDPGGPPPAAGRPLLFVLDGDGYLGLFADAARNLGPIGYELADAPIVVAIGYPEDDIATWMRRRVFDFTPRAALTAFTPVSAHATPRGGLNAFLDLLDVVRARVASTLDADARRSALFGHSLGGLATAYAAFTRPGFMHSYLPISPSFWWDFEHMAEQEQRFAAQVRSTGAFPDMFMAIGGAEDSLPSALPSGTDVAAATREIEARAAVASVRACATRLETLAAQVSGRFAYLEPPLETHCGVPFVVAAPALRFAFGPMPHRQATS